MAGGDASDVRGVKNEEKWTENGALGYTEKNIVAIRCVLAETHRVGSIC